MKGLILIRLARIIDFMGVGGTTTPKKVIMGISRDGDVPAPLSPSVGSAVSSPYYRKLKFAAAEYLALILKKYGCHNNFADYSKLKLIQCLCCIE